MLPCSRLKIIGSHLLNGQPQAGTLGHIEPQATATAGSAHGQVIVITGCTSGLGLYLAHEYIRLGHVVVGCGRRADIIQALNKDYETTPSSFHVVDISKADDVANFAQEVDKRHYGVDALLCCAGIGGFKKDVSELPLEGLQSIVDINLKGVMFTNKYFIPIMLKDLQDRKADDPVKRVINFSSGLGHTTQHNRADYCSVKWGVEGWSKCVAQEFQRNATKCPHTKDRIICVPFAPGVVQSEMNRSDTAAPTEQWCKDAAPFILQIQPHDNGSSVTMPGYYSGNYQSSWVVPSGAKMNTSIVQPEYKNPE